MRLLLALVGLLLLGGCSPDESAPPTEQPRAISIGTTDGVALRATLYRAKTPQLALLLLHDWRRSSADWGTLPTELQAAGVTVLTLDARGHGASQPVANLDGLRYTAVWVEDAALALDVLHREAGANVPVGIVGAGHGGSTALGLTLKAPQTPTATVTAGASEDEVAKLYPLFDRGSNGKVLTRVAFLTPAIDSSLYKPAADQLVIRSYGPVLRLRGLAGRTPTEVVIAGRDRWLPWALSLR